MSADFVLSQLLRNYGEDGGFTGSSMGRAIEAAEGLETRFYHELRGYPDDPGASYRRLSALLRYMQSGWGWAKADMETAARWAESLEGWARGAAGDRA